MDKVDRFVEELFDRARACGFTAAEAYISSGESFEATLHDGELLSYEVSGSFGLGFRGLLNGKLGSASTQTLDDDAARQLVTGAAALARMIECGDEQFFYPGAKAYPELPRRGRAQAATAGEKIEKARALERAALTVSLKVKQIQDVGVFTSSGSVRIVNSLGLNVAHESDCAGVFVAPVAREGDQVNAASKFYFGLDLTGFDAEKLAREAVTEAVNGLGGAPVPSGEYPVILRRDAAATLLGTFSSVFSAESAQKGLSLLKGREGEQIAAACVTLLDDPLLPGAFCSCPFDAEGVPTRKKAVIENGRLTTLLHDLKTAAKQGVSSTGNGARGSYSSSVTVAPANFFIAPGAHQPDRMIAEMPRGLLITDFQGMHSGADAVTGDFSLGAKGFLIENGAIVRPVAGITVAGNFFTLLQNIEKIGGDTWFGLPGVSSFGSPSLWVNGLKIAGH